MVIQNISLEAHQPTPIWFFADLETVIILRNFWHENNPWFFLYKMAKFDVNPSSRFLCMSKKHKIKIIYVLRPLYFFAFLTIAKLLPNFYCNSAKDSFLLTFRKCYKNLQVFHCKKIVTIFYRYFRKQVFYKKSRIIDLSICF